MCRHFARDKESGRLICRYTGKDTHCYDSQQATGCPIRPRPPEAPEWTGPTGVHVRLARREGKGG